jgi:hypothetical protein
MDPAQAPSWHRVILVQFNRVLDASRAENEAVDHALRPREDWALVAAERGITGEMVAAERGLAWRSLLLSHRCSVYDATDDAAATAQNDAFSASGSEYLME